LSDVLCLLGAWTPAGCGALDGCEGGAELSVTRIPSSADLLTWVAIAWGHRCFRGRA